MAKDYRARSLGAALRYRGREGMWSWLLHRFTGLGVLLFLVVHVVDTGLVIYSPEFYDHALAIYKHPVFRIAELAIFFSVLFHAFNATTGSSPINGRTWHSFSGSSMSPIGDKFLQTSAAPISR